MIEILLAIGAGILTIAAPCILLPLPIILGTSVGQQSRTRPVFITMGFVLTFAVLGLSLNFIIQNLGLSANALRDGAAVVLAIFAIFMIWPTPFERMTMHMSGLINKANQTGQKASQGNWGGFIIGVVIGIVWAPCAGPILGSILTLVAQQQNLGRASILLIAYALGAGFPMLAIAYGGQVLTTKFKKIAPYAVRLQQFFGVLILLLAVAIYFQYDTVIQSKLVEKIPSFNSLDSILLNTFKHESMEEIKLSDYGSAPEFTGIDNWLNSDPLTLQSLRGKVVLVDFWTYSCINCIRTLPYVTGWYEKYKDDGLVVVGVHTPEFAFEKDTSNVQTALKRYNINYPVAQDNDYGTWQVYGNEYWPAHYLIDQNGKIVYVHFGEGNYQETEQAIQQLLGLGQESEITGEAGQRQIKTPEIYFGLNRLEYITKNQTPSDSSKQFTFPKDLSPNNFALDGLWSFTEDSAILKSNTGRIRLHFYSKDVHIVASSQTEATVRVMVDGQLIKTIDIKGSDLHTLFEGSDSRERTLEIEIQGSGFEAFTFTFG